MNKRYKILLVDDEEAWSNNLKDELESLGFEVIYEEKAENTLKLIREFNPDIVLLDILFHGENKGKPTFDKLRAKYPNLLIIILTSTMVDTSYKREDYPGLALDYPKGALNPEDAQTYKIFTEEIRKIIEGSYDIDKYLEEFKTISLVGKSQAFRNTCRLLLKAAETDSNVLITGETGTGKGLVANAIHHFSKRKNMPFVTVNCGGITPSLIGSELFGVCAKSATQVDEKEGYFEQADKGTIFLDEIGTMPIDQQTSLLRVLQDKKISRVGSKKTCNCKNKKHPDHTAIQLDVRVIAATNEEIPMAIKERRFRQDLFRRLKTFTIEMPPLRERKEDIEVLYRYFINKLKSKLAKTNMIDKPRPDVQEMLENYHWPENIGELESVIERAMIITNSAILLREDFSLVKEENNNSDVWGHAADLANKFWGRQLKLEDLGDYTKQKGLKQIVVKLIERWLNEKHVRPKRKELADCMGTTDEIMGQILNKCCLKLSNWPKEKRL